MELREWLIILGLVLVAIIVVDGVRRLQRQRRVPRLDLNPETPASREPTAAQREEQLNWELPNGGARVVRSDRAEDSPARRDADVEDDEEMLALEEDDEFDEAPSRFANLAPSRLLDGVSRVRAARQAASERRVAERKAKQERQAEADKRLAEQQAEETARRAEAERLVSRRRSDDRDEHRLHAEAFDDDASVDGRDDYHDAIDHEDDERYLADYDEDVVAPRDNVVAQHPAVERAKRHHVNAARARDTLADADEVVVISVIARNEEGFYGPDLLKLVMACGLRYSEMGIFHRFETESDASALQFSMVNVIKPGTFDLDAMDEEFTTPGVTFLMPLPGAEDTRAAFDAMFETAMVLVRNLGGELKDEHRSVMTAQTVEFARQRVHDFERRMRLHRHQAN